MLWFCSLCCLVIKSANLNACLLVCELFIMKSIYSWTIYYCSMSCSIKIKCLFLLSLGSLVLCNGVCERRRPDVSDPTLTEVWWSSLSFLCSWGHFSTDVSASARRHLQVKAHTHSTITKDVTFIIDFMNGCKMIYLWRMCIAECIINIFFVNQSLSCL